MTKNTFLTLLACFSFQLKAGDFIISHDFEDYSSPKSAADRARFLTQATYGPTPGSMAAMGNQSYAQWISQQINLAPTLHRPALESITLNRGPDGGVGQIHRQGLWNQFANTAEDQLRQRMAFALSEIFVISDKNKFIKVRVMMATEFYDVLVRGAFGNYRDLLEDVARSPAMGWYLSHLKNRKRELSNPLTNSYYAPDENFAREVMQLFSIGVFERHQDFSLVDGDPNTPGIQTLETYDQNIVTNLARVMTGFGYQCNGPATISNGAVSVDIGAPDCKPGAGRICQGPHCNFGTGGFFGGPYPAPNSEYNGLFNPDVYRPMICYPRFHDIGRDDNNNPNPVRPNSPPYPDEPYQDKRIIGHLPGIGNGTLPMYQDECNSLNGIPEPTDLQLQKMQACVDYCDGELGQALDALFYHPNTPPMMARLLIQRFTTSNPSPAYIQAVAAAFIDNGNGVRGDLGAVISAILLHHDARGPRFRKDAHFGKLKEPMLKLRQYYRAMETVTSDPEQLNWGPYRDPDTEGAFGQRVFGANSVFNFFSPDYQPPGDFANANLYAPEFEILTDNTVISGQNTFHINVCNGYGSLNAANPPFRHPNCSGGTDGSAFGFHPPAGSAYIPQEVLQGLPDDFEAMVEALNLRLLYGEMSGTFNPPTGMKGILKTRIEGPYSTFDKRHQAIIIIQLILASPEYAVQR